MLTSAMATRYADRLDELVTNGVEVVTVLQPSLAASILTAGPDDRYNARLVQALASQVGRVVVDGWPTGVATTWSSHHRGPWRLPCRIDGQWPNR